MSEPRSTATPQRLQVLVDREWLEQARCPNKGCDNEGTIAVQVGHGEWEPEQCQWCHERYAVLKALPSAARTTDEIHRECLAEAKAELALADTLEALAAEATDGPWAWDQRGEKVNEWGLGVAMNSDEKPIAGRFTDEDAIYVEYVCSHEAATCNYDDPELICTLRNNLPIIIAALRGLSLAQSETTQSNAEAYTKHGARIEIKENA